MASPARHPPGARRAGPVLLAVLMLLAVVASSARADTVRLGILQYGTVSWEVAVLQARGFGEREGVDLHVVPLASPQAAAVALQGGAVDVIVSDWIWVSRQRAEGRDYVFVPYSLMVGALLASPGADVADVSALRGRDVGVAGGPVDKSWLLLRAWSRRTLGEDLGEMVEPTFAAPPLLNVLASRGELDAVLNYWHYAARLLAAGSRKLADIGEDVLPALGIEQPVPLLGWVFDEAWASANADALRAFLRADYAAKHLMLRDEAVWSDIRPLLKADDDGTAAALRDTWRTGVPDGFGEAERDAAERLFAILAAEGGAELVGDSRSLDPGTFWDGFEVPPWPR